MVQVFVHGINGSGPGLWLRKSRRGKSVESKQNLYLAEDKDKCQAEIERIKRTIAAIQQELHYLKNRLERLESDGK